MADTLFIVFGVNITLWKIIGWAGAFMFAGRWIVQMHHSRRAGKPVIPTQYWIMSLCGSVMLIAYFTFSPQRGTVGFIQNFFPVFVAGYNLYLDLNNRNGGNGSEPPPDHCQA